MIIESNIPSIQGKTMISFDFDGTLGHKPHIQRLAQELCRDPHNEVHIITRRYDHVHPEAGDEITQVLGIASQLNLTKDRIHFTNRQMKITKIKELGIHIHWDDDLTEIATIRKEYPECIGLLTL